MAIKIKYHSSFRLKALLFTVGLALVIGLLYFSKTVTENLRNESRQFVNFYFEIYAEVATEYEGDDFSFLLEKFIGQAKFPMIVSDPSGNPTDWKNLPVAPDDKTEESYARVKDILKNMDEANDPIPIKYVDPESGEELIIAVLHYGDSKFITQLRILPYIEILIAALFILLGFAGFQFIRRSEQRLIWVGMAKEAAHQLGTPLSSLLGWVEMLEGAEREKVKSLLPEMRSDIRRLNRVANRFSQIGAGGGLRLEKVDEIIDGVVEYLKKRLPQRGKQIEIRVSADPTPEVMLNKDLFEWALENLIKNSADAIEAQSGLIEIATQHSPEGKTVTITIKDNGKGILPRFRGDIFKPGYSTKSTGWGLGLSLSKRIIEDYHMGMILLKESKLGVGTTMEITFKL